MQSAAVLPRMLDRTAMAAAIVRAVAMSRHRHDYQQTRWQDYGRYILVTYTCRVQGCTSSYTRREKKG
jgi:hypothetical protein